MGSTTTWEALLLLEYKNRRFVIVDINRNDPRNAVNPEGQPIVVVAEALVDAAQPM